MNAVITRENAEQSLASTASPQSQLPEVFSLSDLRRIILKRYAVILLCITVALSGAVVYSLLKKPRYEATAHIAIIFDENADPDGQAASSNADTSDMQTRLETQVRILQSEPLAMAVIQQLHLDSNPAFCKPDPKHASIDSPVRRQELIKAFDSALHVTIMPKSELIEIRFRSYSPQVAMDVVNTLVSAFVEHNYKVKYMATMQVADWLQKQLDEIKANVEDYQERVSEFEKEHGVWFTDTPGASGENQSSTISKLDELNEKLTAAEEDRILKEASWRLAEQGNAELVTSPTPDLTLQTLRTQENDLRSQYAQVSAQYGDSYPKVVELKAQLQDVEARIQAEIDNHAQRFKNDYLAARQSEDMLRAMVEKQKQEAYQLNESAVQYTILRHQLDSSRDLYDSLLKKLKEAGIAAGLRSTKANVVDPATLPLTPVEPNMPLNLALGLGAGLVFGLASAFVLENLDSSLRTVEEVETYCGLPSLAVIPMFNKNGAYRSHILSTNGNGTKKSAAGMITMSLDANGNGFKDAADVITLSKPKSQAAEAYRSLRTALLLSSYGGPVKTIVVTSSVLGEGKTSTSINTAVVLAQKGVRVLLVDADLRRPSVHKHFGLSNKSGLSSVVSGISKLEDVAFIHPKMSNLTLMTSGPIAPYPAEMLGSRCMSELLLKWKNEFDYVILDTPPVLPVTDAVLLAAQADVCVMVLRWGKIGWQPLRRSCELLLRARARIAGVVLNGVNINAPDYYYYGGGRYQNYDYSSSRD